MAVFKAPSLDPATGRLREKHVPAYLTQAAQNSTYAQLTPWSFEMARAASYGDSYGNNAAGQAADVASAFPYRVAARLRTQPLVDRSVSGTRSDQIQAQVEATWTAPGYGVVFIPDAVINDAGQGSSTTTTKEAFRSILAHLVSQSTASSSSIALRYGPGWTAGSGPSGSYADVSFVGNTAWIRYAAVTGAGGTFTVKDSAGTTLATVSTGGYSQPFTGVVKIAGQTSGTNSVRVAVTSGTVGLVGVIAPSPVPPLIVWFQPGPVDPARGVNSNIAAKIAACATVLPDFPTVLPVPVDSNYNSTTMLTTDGLHLNDLGNTYVANLITSALASQPYVDGLNRLTQPAAYTVSPPSYNSPGSTTPAAPTGAAATAGNQANVTWVRSTDGGATITSQVIQATADDGATWNDVATGLDPAATSATITTGLTAGGTYKFRVAAVNVNGRGAYSTLTASVTAGASPVTYSADALTGSGAMGTATTGGQTWTPTGSTVYQRNADGAGPAVSAGSGQTDTQVDDGQANGTFSVTLVNLVTNGSGIAFNNNAGHSTGYVFSGQSGAAYKLSKRTAVGAFSTLVTSSVMPQPGDKISVVKNGSSIICKVNGVTAITTTDATYTGTSHGIWAWSDLTAKFKDYSHTNLTS